MSFVVVGYFTVGTLYEKEATRLIQSLRKFGVPYQISPVESLGDWYRNTQRKPQFLREAIDRFPCPIVYVDVDAEFLAYPALFDDLVERPEVIVGAHILDHGKRGRAYGGKELLSGTLYFRNCDEARSLLDQWSLKCQQGGNLWDQVALMDVLRNKPFFALPEEYCTIYDYMSDVSNPVIRHYQASRRAKCAGEKPVYQRLPKKQVDSYDNPRRVGKGGLVRFRRKWRDG